MNTKFQFINLSYLDLMTDGDQDMKATMIEMLLDEIPVEINKMQELYQAEDWNELREVSHKMKSTLSFVGNNPMTKANKRIEEIAKSEGNSVEIPDLLMVLQELYPKALAELQLVETAIQ